MGKTSERENLALDRAHRYLATRPRSEKEIRIRLNRYGHKDMVIEQTIHQLRQSGLIDDMVFAAYWKENRTRFNPRSVRLMTRELEEKGISPEIIRATTSSINDDNEAYRAGKRKSRLLPAGDYINYRRKLEAYLRRRGFDYSVIRSIVDRLWQEKQREGTNG